jgi:transposase
MPPAYVKPYVKRQKNDAADAEAICEAVTRANMRFVETKTPEQQSCLMLHRTRHLLIRQQTAVINAIRAHLAEFGVVAPVGRRGVSRSCSTVPPLQARNGCPRWLVLVLALWVFSCDC